MQATQGGYFCGSGLAIAFAIQESDRMCAWKSVQEKISLVLCCFHFCFSRSQKPWRCVPRSNMVSVRPAFVKGFARLLTSPLCSTPAWLTGGVTVFWGAEWQNQATPRKRSTLLPRSNFPSLKLAKEASESWSFFFLVYASLHLLFCCWAFWVSWDHAFNIFFMTRR